MHRRISRALSCPITCDRIPATRSSVFSPSELQVMAVEEEEEGEEALAAHPAEAEHVCHERRVEINKE